MIIETRDFGLVEIAEDDILTFPAGIPGFEEDKQFVILHDKTAVSPFFRLQAVRKGGPTFIITEPRYVIAEYNPEVSEGAVREIELDDPEDALIYFILTIPEEIENMTANLRAPVIINTRKSLGKQVVLEYGDYPIKFRVIDELRKKGRLE